MLANIFLLVINAAAGFITLMLLARFYMQWQRISFRNQLGQFVVSTTDWIVRPLGRVVPGMFGLDMASLLPAWVVQVMLVAFELSLRGAVFSGNTAAVIGGLAGVGLIELVRMMVYLLVGPCRSGRGRPGGQGLQPGGAGCGDPGGGRGDAAGAAHGVDLPAVRHALIGGSAPSKALHIMGQRMVERHFSAGIQARLHHKDFAILMHEACLRGLPLPIAAPVWQQLNALMGAGWGREDTSSLLRVLER